MEEASILVRIALSVLSQAALHQVHPYLLQPQAAPFHHRVIRVVRILLAHFLQVLVLAVILLAQVLLSIQQVPFLQVILPLIPHLLLQVPIPRLLQHTVFVSREPIMTEREIVGNAQQEHTRMR